MRFAFNFKTVEASRVNRNEGPQSIVSVPETSSCKGSGLEYVGCVVNQILLDNSGEIGTVCPCSGPLLSLVFKR